MKSIRLFSMAVLGMAMVLISCSGEDGEQGPQGKQGPAGENGVNGADGADGISCWDLNGNGTGDAEEDINEDGNFDALDCQGANGTDGNANVQEHTFNLDVFVNYDVLNLDLNNIVDNPSNYAYLYYIDHKNGFRYSIPGSLIGNTYYTRVYTEIETGVLRIEFYETSDDSSYVIPGGEYTQVVVVAIELTNTSKNSENLMAELKAAGVDTSDYNAVAEYFGLE
ncbi:MAG: collagen-like protein [Muricauda sp.]|nr:collagen-like protein [Allomuricauda sp.]MBA4745418.1 collagen-like protein [Allomuricauda sp.]